MTARQVYEAVLIELNKVNAPSLLLEDFNYLFNRAINQYINKKYNIYDVNQQSTDDMRVLKSTAILTPKRAIDYYKDSDDVIMLGGLYGATYEVDLPDDYLHILNCICVYKVNKTFKCYDKDTYVQFGAERLTADIWGQIINNFYMRPSYKRPYYYIHNVNTAEEGEMPTNPIVGDDYHIEKGTDYMPGETTVPEIITYTLYTSQSSLTYESNQSGVNSAKTITVTSHDSKGNDVPFTVTSTNSHFSHQVDGNTITVYPISANSSTTADITATLTIKTSNKEVSVKLTHKKLVVQNYIYYKVSETYQDYPTAITEGTCVQLNSNNKVTINTDIENVKTLWIGTIGNTSGKTITVADKEGDPVEVLLNNDVNISGSELYSLTGVMGILDNSFPLTITVI